MYELLQRIQQLDIQLQFYLNQQWRNPFFDAVLPLFSSVFLFCGVASLGLSFIAWRYGAKAFIYAIKISIALGIAAAITYGLCGIVKDSVGRLRPYQVIAGSYYKDSGQWERNSMRFVATETKGESFPSRHAAGSMAICLGLLLMLGKRMRRWQRGILFLLPLMVGWSRLYLGKHYVSDVAAGIVLGALTMGILWLFWRYAEQHFFDSRQRTW